MTKYILTIMLFFIQATPPPVDFQFSDSPNKKLATAINKRVRYTESFTAAYLVGENVEYYNHNGNLNTVYDIASITKTFTAIAVIKLQSDGKLHVDDKAAQHMAFYDTNVTIRHLITHTACKPYGKRYSYSNLNYVALKEIIESASGKKYHEFIEEKILIPLQMNDTTAKYSNGAGSIISTPRDLIKYMYMLSNYGKGVLTEKEYLLMMESTNEMESVGAYYWNTGGFEAFNDGEKITGFYKSGRWHESVCGIEIFPGGKALLYIGKPWVSGTSGTILRWRNRTWRFLRQFI